jgi:Anti-sigma-K factor rskA
VAVLSGSDAATGATGYAVFPDDEAGFIVVDGLPRLTGDQVYQAWFVGEGAPVSAGLIDLGSDGLGVLTGLQIVPDTAVVALSVEERPGATAPTTTPLVVGEVRDQAAA